MPAQQVELHLTVVVPERTPAALVVTGLAGRELPGVPGSWIAGAHLSADCPEVLCPGTEDDFDEVLQAEADADAGLDEGR